LLSLKSFEWIPRKLGTVGLKPLLEKWSGLKVGNVMDLIEPLRFMHLDNFRKILANAEVEFGLIYYDGTPYFAEAENA